MKLSIITFLSVAVMLGSCNQSTNEEIEKSDKAPNHEKVSLSAVGYVMSSNRSYMINLNDHDSRKSYFLSTTPSIRYDIWLNKIQQVIADNSLTQTEESKLQELIDEMSINAFDFGTTEHSDFKTFALTWASSALAIFDKNDLTLIITTVGDFLYQDPGDTVTNADDPPASGGASSECSCNMASDWCWGETSCSGGCGFGTSVGCGFLWMFDCEKVCN